MPGYKRFKRADWAGSAEKQQQKAKCGLLGRAKVRADTVRLRSVTQGKPESRNFPDTGANRGQNQTNQGHCMERMRVKKRQRRV